MTWLVTGGAGYIGSHVVRAFLSIGIDVVVLDDFSSGRPDFVPDGVPVEKASITDAAAVARIFAAHDIVGVVHLAAIKYAGVSVRQPLESYAVNVEGTRILLQECVNSGVLKFVYSSSAAIFGTPSVEVVSEDTAKVPESPYGEGKLIGEWLLRNVAVARELAGLQPLVHTSLRYFNVAGSGDLTRYDASPHNLFPLLFAAVTQGRRPTIFGADYPTPDGSCVRDYLHVVDVAEAHVAVAKAMVAGTPIAPAYNLGRGQGVSVRKIISVVEDVVGRRLPYDVRPRRPGDPARLVTCAALANTDLGWTAEWDLHHMVTSAWDAWQHAAS